LTPPLDDKGIAVKIRGNSHYRNSRTCVTGQVGMLIGLCLAKVSRADGGDVAADTADIGISQHPGEGAFVLSFCIKFERMKNNEKNR